MKMWEMIISERKKKQYLDRDCACVTCSQVTHSNDKARKRHRRKEKKWFPGMLKKTWACTIARIWEQIEYKIKCLSTTVGVFIDGFYGELCKIEQTEFTLFSLCYLSKLLDPGKMFSVPLRGMAGAALSWNATFISSVELSWT